MSEAGLEIVEPYCGKALSGVCTVLYFETLGFNRLRVNCFRGVGQGVSA